MYTGDPTRLREARKAAGFASASAAARANQWGEAAYRHHENGTRPFGIKHAATYAAAYKVQPQTLFAEFDNNDNLKPLILESLKPTAKDLRIREKIQSVCDELDISFVVDWSLDNIDFHALTKSFFKYAFSKPFLEAIFGDISRGGVVSHVMEDDSMGITAPRGSLLLLDSRQSELKTPDGIWLLLVDNTPMVRRLNHIGDDQVELSADGRPGQATKVSLERVKLQGEVKWIGKRTP